MIFAIESIDQCKHPRLIDEMFCMRAEVFSGRLGWDVTVENGREIDRFDAEDPLYLLSLDEQSGQLRGAVRLLPTTGPNMLRDVFSVLMPGGAVESPLIWESSRFAINARIFDAKDRAEANHISKIRRQRASSQKASTMSSTVRILESNIIVSSDIIILPRKSRIESHATR